MDPAYPTQNTSGQLKLWTSVSPCRRCRCRRCRRFRRRRRPRCFCSELSIGIEWEVVTWSRRCSCSRSLSRSSRSLSPLATPPEPLRELPLLETGPWCLRLADVKQAHDVRPVLNVQGHRDITSSLRIACLRFRGALATALALRLRPGPALLAGMRITLPETKGGWWRYQTGRWAQVTQAPRRHSESLNTNREKLKFTMVPQRGRSRSAQHAPWRIRRRPPPPELRARGGLRVSLQLGDVDPLGLLALGAPRFAPARSSWSFSAVRHRRPSWQCATV